MRMLSRYTVNIANLNVLNDALKELFRTLYMEMKFCAEQFFV